MKTLIEISHATLGLPEIPVEDGAWKQRRSARAVIFNDAGHVVLLHASRDGYYKLPGGGVEEGEDWSSAVIREAMEETGCNVRLRPPILGEIVEYRARWPLRQVSVCGLADVYGDMQAPAMMPDELEIGLAPVWMSLDEAIAHVESATPDDYEGRFIAFRDAVFLKEARRVLFA